MQTYSAVICVTSGKEVKPEPMKESLYWVIFSAASQSSTELTLLRSGAARSNKGWWCEGLQQADMRSGGGSFRISAVSLKQSVFVYANEFISALTQGGCCWCRLWKMQGCGSFCPTCWQYLGTLAARSCLSASIPASVGAELQDSPWELAAWSPALWHLSPGEAAEEGTTHTKRLVKYFFCQFREMTCLLFLHGCNISHQV